VNRTGEAGALLGGFREVGWAATSATGIGRCSAPCTWCLLETRPA